MIKRRIGTGIAAVALMCAVQVAGTAPADAARILKSTGDVTFTGGSSMTLYGTTHSRDNTSLGQLSDLIVGPHGTNAVSDVPEPAGWLMMLLGFGLLGATTRRGGARSLETQPIA